MIKNHTKQESIMSHRKKRKPVGSGPVLQGVAAKPHPKNTQEYWTNLIEMWDKLSMVEKITCIMTILMVLGLGVTVVCNSVPVIENGLDQKSLPGGLANQDGRSVTGVDHHDWRSSCATFKLTQGDPATARVVLIGAYHDEQAASLACLEGVAHLNVDHTVLVETAPKGITVKCSDFQIKDKMGRTCKGWEDRSFLAGENLRVLAGAYNMLLEKLTLSTKGYWSSPIEFQAIVRRYSDNLRKSLNVAVKETKHPGTHFEQVDFSKAELNYLVLKTMGTAVSDVLVKLNSGMRPAEIFSDLKKNVDREAVDDSPVYTLNQDKVNVAKRNIDIYDPEFIRNMTQRQESLFRAIEEAASDGPVFPVAGLFHINPVDGQGGSKPVKEFRERLDETFGDEYAVVEPPIRAPGH